MTEPLFEFEGDSWETVTLGDICRRGGGNVQTGPFGSQLHSSDYVADGVPSIMPLNIGNNRINPEGIARIREEDAQRLSRYRLKSGDIVYSRRGDVERRSLVRSAEDGWLCGTGCLRVRLGAGVADPAFVSYYLGHPAAREWIVSHAVGSIMPNLNTAILSAIPVVLPPLDEQRRIAKALESIDDKIELNRQMNRTLEETAGALYRSWFVDFDPVVAKAAARPPAHLSPALAALFPDSFQDSDLGPIPKGWRTSTVDGVVNLIIDHRGKTPTKLGGDWVESGIQAVSAKNVKAGRLVNKSAMGHISEELYRKWMRDELEAGDILMTSEAPLGELLYLPEKVKWCQSQRLFGLRANPEVCLPSFLYGWLSTPECQAELDARSSGTTVMGIRQSELRTVPVLLPSKAIQEKYDEIVSPMLLQIWHNESESETLAALRDALLPKLLSGEVRVKEAEKATEATS